jgi:hypothetical protein
VSQDQPGAGIAVQQTVERADNVPLDPLVGLGIFAAYAAGPLVLGSARATPDAIVTIAVGYVRRR